MNEEERQQWEEEQKRLDRAWYSIDEGQDDEKNPFGNMSNEYMAKKEKQLVEKKKKKMSAKARQIHKVRYI